ncbi:MAG: helix-turn-helix domain-containing protein [Spirochaetaceae bacterium]|jgi:predicted XRE-type DNA-binding protein|nr:helix-turn-helix domain-containing protein [Spirochaetaceae bacterium]
MKGTGQNFDDFLTEQGIYDEVKELATKKLIAIQLQQELEAQNLSKSQMARKMGTSRAAINNILDPSYNTSLGSLERFAGLLGKKIHISLR